MHKQNHNRLAITRKNQEAYENAVIYFNAHQKNKNVTNKFFRGSKLKSKQQDKIHQIRTRYVNKADAWNTRYSANHNNNSLFENQQPIQDGDNQQYTSREKLQNQRMSLDSFRPHLAQYLRQPRKTVRQCNSEFMISAKSAQIPKFNPNNPRQTMPYFTSSNLQTKTNQYLNLILRKSQQNQQQKLKKLRLQQQQQRIKYTIKNNHNNIFMRKMKKSLNKNKNKNYHRKNISQQNYYYYDIDSGRTDQHQSHLENNHSKNNNDNNKSQHSNLSSQNIKHSSAINFNTKSNMIDNQNIRLTGLALPPRQTPPNLNFNGNININTSNKYNRYNRHKKSFSLNQGQNVRLRNPVIKELIDKVKQWEDDQQVLHH